MRILDVSPRGTFPVRRGSDVRVHNLLRNLSARHDVRQFSQTSSLPFGHFTEDQQITERYREHQYGHPVSALISGVSERSWPKAALLTGLALRLTRPRILSEWLRWADVILVEFPWQFEYCRRLRPNAPLVLASHNIETQKFASWGRAQGLEKSEDRGWLRYIHRMEERAAREAALVLTVSDDDRAGMIRVFGVPPNRVLEIPNGSDTAMFAPPNPARKAALRAELGVPPGPLVTYIGCDIPPNRVGLEWVRRTASAAPEFTFAVIGPLFREPRREGNLVITGPVDDLTPWLGAADFSMCPIEHGGGTKIKLLEAMAAALPVVAFEESLHGTGIVPGTHLLVSPRNADEIVLALRRLASSPDLARTLGASARDYVMERHDWRRIAERLETALLQLISSGSVSRTDQSSSQSPRNRG